MILTKEELINTSGGGVSLGAISLIGAAIVFIIGVIDGFVHPKKC